MPAVDWPELPDLAERTPLERTPHFAVHAADLADAQLVERAHRWSPELESIYAGVSRRLGRELPSSPVNIVFTRSYDARCPARGLASPFNDPPLLMLFVNEDTPDAQIRAVLAHEMGHHLTMSEDFVGDGVLTEGIANWGASDLMLAWQGYLTWDAAVRDYLAAGDYVSIADDTALNPRPGEQCLLRRDRVYNIRTAFVDWLIRRYGLESVLAMPYIEVELPAPTGEDADVLRIPDYKAATGHELRALEMLWLQDLRSTPWPPQ